MRPHVALREETAVPQPGEEGYIEGHETPEHLKGKRFCHLRPNCRLLVMTATYRQPMVGVQESKIGKIFGCPSWIERRQAYLEPRPTGRGVLITGRQLGAHARVR